MTNVTAIKQQGTGVVAGAIACALAVVGILSIGIIFIPIATVVTIIGSIIAIKNRNPAGIGINLLAWVLTFIGLCTSPVLLGFLGLAVLTR